jgi:hypothetical protein
MIRSAQGTADAPGRNVRQKAGLNREILASCNADVNAARNIAAGHAVTARGRPSLPGRTNREPQLALPPA